MPVAALFFAPAGLYTIAAGDTRRHVLICPESFLNNQLTEYKPKKIAMKKT